MADTATEGRLIRRLQAGDQSVIATLYDEHGGLAYSLALRVVRDPGRAEEIVQDVFVSLWKNAGQFDPDRGSIRAWLMRMVRNRAIDYSRHRQARGGPEFELDVALAAPVDDDPATMAVARVESASIQEAMAAIPNEQRLVVNLAYFGGYTHQEIARMTGMALGTVKGRLRLGLSKLRSDLRVASLHDAGDVAAAG